jgi:hypothetical protein
MRNARQCLCATLVALGASILSGSADAETVVPQSVVYELA